MAPAHRTRQRGSGWPFPRAWTAYDPRTNARSGRGVRRTSTACAASVPARRGRGAAELQRPDWRMSRCDRLRPDQDGVGALAADLLLPLARLPACIPKLDMTAASSWLVQNSSSCLAFRQRTRSASWIGMDKDTNFGLVILHQTLVRLSLYKRRSFPVFGFSGRWNLALGRGKRRLPEKLRCGGSRLGVCDMLSPIQEPKWKSWFLLPCRHGS